MWEEKFVFLLFYTSYLVTQINGQCSPTPCGVNTQCTVSRTGAAVCRCQPGYDHLPGGNTIDGCPVRITDSGSSSGGGGSRRAQQPQPRRHHQQTFLSNRLSPHGAIGVFRQEPISLNPCSPSPCGQGATCRPVGDRPLCTCLPGYTGDPYTVCEQNPCDNNPCGVQAECEARGNRAICKCPRGFTGDPYVRCDDNPCNQDPCGANADCTAEGNRAVCKCRPNYEGDPFVQCVLDPCLISPCGVNADCEKSSSGTRSGVPSSRAICKCRPGYEGDPFVRCTLNPCHDNPCGPNAECTARGSSAVCRCLEGYEGDPFVNCELNPCLQSPCGTNAECTSRGRTAVCRCPEGYSGDPYTNCRLDPCSRNPCGENAECRNNGNSAVCKCPPQYVGDPYIICQPDPCRDTCGLNTDCENSGTRAICRCRSGYTGSPYSRSGCRADPCSAADICGLNAECTNAGDRPVCNCLPNHVGDPYTQCYRGECVSNSECPTNRACKDYNCVDPCRDSCGSGADCQVQNHVAICRCPRGYTGDPFQNCRRFTRDEICAACGANTDCEVTQDDRPICKCKRNYIGNPLTGCRYECTSDRDCSNSQHQCIENRCQPACRQGVCGENANCRARNHRPQCSCPEDFLGDPYSRCYTECTAHNDCADNKACVRFRCRDPCQEPNPNVCGQGANCEAKGHKAICSCPRGYTGDPFVSCRQFTKQDLCNPNPCGSGALCQPGVDRSGGDRPVCTCPRGYRGDPVVSCTRGECSRDDECPSSQACYDFNCRDPCINACGASSDCRAINHGAVCSCPSGYVGDPLVACRQARNRSKVIGLSRRFKRNDISFLMQFY